MKNILTTLAVFAMALMISSSAQAQKRSYVTGYFALDLDGGKQGVIAPIDDKGNATIDNVKLGTHTAALLVPAVQKVREAAARGAMIEVESFSWGVANQKTGGTSNNGKPNRISVQAKSAPLKDIVKHNGEEYYKIELENILVSSYQSGGSSGGDRPMESLSLNFTKIEWKIKENKQ